MADELDWTCENCRYEDEDMEGAHCRHCIHNAIEHFEPKVIVPTEAEIRAKAIDELKNKICMHFADWKHSEDDKCIKDLIELASESVEEIAEEMKGDK